MVYSGCVIKYNSESSTYSVHTNQSSFLFSKNVSFNFNSLKEAEDWAIKYKILNKSEIIDFEEIKEEPNSISYKKQRKRKKRKK